MSYREMRNFTEMMRALGYPRLISMENFRTPNFPLIAEILQWLITRYDQNADISQNIDTEQDRVIFVKMIAHFMMTRAHVRLNTKRLYQADGYAVRELLKVTTLLYQSMIQSHTEDDDASIDSSGIQDVLDANRLREIKETRQLASQIVGKGATLSDLLSREVDLRESRLTALSGSGQLEPNEIEKAIQKSISATETEIQKQEASLGNISNDEAALDAKIEKKRAELDRNEKRLSTLQSVRPAYMDEYEQLEGELNALYNAYLAIFRNLAWLEGQYEDLVRHQLDQSEDKEMTLKKMADQLRKAEQNMSGDTKTNGKMNGSSKKGWGGGEDDFENLLDDDDDDDDGDEDDDEDDDEEENEMMIGRGSGVVPGTKNVRRGYDGGRGNMVPMKDSQPVNRNKNFGSMAGVEHDDDDDDDDDDDSEDDDDDSDDSDDDEDNEDEEDWGMNANNVGQPTRGAKEEMFVDGGAGGDHRNHYRGGVPGSQGNNLRPRAAEYTGTRRSRGHMGSGPGNSGGPGGDSGDDF